MPETQQPPPQPPPLDDLPDLVLETFCSISHNVRRAGRPVAHSPFRPRHFAAIEELVARGLVSVRRRGSAPCGSRTRAHSNSTGRA
jgi:hypothetical protein